MLTFPFSEDWDKETLASNSSVSILTLIHVFYLNFKNEGFFCFHVLLKEKRNCLFMKELRNLFALLVGTKRKYVDPSKAVDILKEAFQCGSADSQQVIKSFVFLANDDLTC